MSTEPAAAQYLEEASNADPQPLFEILVKDRNTPYSSVLPVLGVLNAHSIYNVWIDTYRPGFIVPDIHLPIGVDAAWPETKPTPLPLVIYCGLLREGQETSSRVITLGVAPDGKPLIDGVPTDASSLFRVLSEAAKQDPQPVILVAPDPRTNFLSVTELMLAVQMSGIPRMRIALGSSSPPAK